MQLQVTDSGGLKATSDLQVNVTNNSEPTLGTYPAATVNPGANTTVMPNQGVKPSDNGSVTSLTASAPNFTGTFSGDPATGNITVNNAGPGGVYTVTVTATDNCLKTSTTTFQLTVNRPPQITGKTISRQLGGPLTGSQIATVSDAETPAGNLTVMVTSVPTGLTVNVASNNNGTITANVAASCNAALGPNLVGLKVTDGGGLTATGNLTVNVTLGNPLTYRGGLEDNLALPADPAFRRAALTALVPLATWKNFDDTAINHWVGHSFTNLPLRIVKAELEIRMKPLGGGSDNDGLALGLNANSNFAYSTLISALPGASGTWGSNPATVFTLDLANLPGGGNILAKVAADRFLDVRIQDDTVVDYVKLRVWTCPPLFPAGGLPHEALGQALLSSDSSGALIVSQLDSPGDNGYLVRLGESGGYVAKLQSTNDLRSPGVFIETRIFGRVNGMDDQLIATARIAGTGTNANFNVDFSPLRSPKSRVELFAQNGTLLRAFDLTNNTPVALDTGGPSLTTANISNTAVDSATAKKYNESRSNIASVVLPGPVGVTGPGGVTTAGVTKIRVTPLNVVSTATFVSSATVTAMQTGSQDAVTSTGEGVVAFGKVFSPRSANPLLTGSPQSLSPEPVAGALTEANPARSVATDSPQSPSLEPSLDGLTVANLDPSAPSGVTMDLGRANSAGVTFDTLDPTGTAPNGAFVRATATGTVNGVPDQPLGELRLTKGDSNCSITADFGALNSSTQRVQVLDNNVLVADFPGHTGTVATVPTWLLTVTRASVRGWDAKSKQKIAFRVNGTDYLGDELSILAEGATNRRTATQDTISALALTASGLSEFTLVDAQSTLCAPALAATIQAFAANGGNSSVNVTSPCGDNWTAVSQVPWITIPPAGSSGAGDGVVNYTVAANNSNTPRSGMIYIANQVYVVLQGALFNDVAADTSLLSTSIGKLSAWGITGGCDGAGNYCPNATVTRGQMAIFLVRAFGL